MSLNLPYRICECGCGESFKPVRHKQKFYTRTCRYRYYNAVQRRATKAANAEYLASIMPLQCKVCGYDRCVSALDSHHTNPSQKERANDSMGRWIFFKPDKFKVKVQNTSFIILCKNCHAELHANSPEASELC
jgi:hypothetical protein